MPPKARSNSDAATVLRCHDDEVASVDGDVATTSDGQRYRLTGPNAGDYVWLKNGEEVPDARAAEEVQTEEVQT